MAWFREVHSQGHNFHIFATKIGRFDDKSSIYRQTCYMAEKGHNMVTRLKTLSFSSYGIPHSSPFYCTLVSSESEYLR